MTGMAPLSVARIRDRSARGAWTRYLGRAAAWLAACHETAHQRRALEMLDDYRLRDIGLTRLDVVGETSRRFWEL